MILGAEILEEAFALADHCEQSFTGAVVFLVGAHVLRDFSDALREKCNLDFRGSGIAFFAGELSDDFGLYSFFQLVFIFPEVWLKL